MMRREVVKMEKLEEIDFSLDLFVEGSRRRSKGKRRDGIRKHLYFKPWQGEF